MVKFLKSAASVATIALNDEVIEFCLLGRSNVGKSTLINALANQKIAKVSKNPGQTKLLNFYDFNKYRLVDLPGYGYACVSKRQKYVMDGLLLDYLNNRSNLFAIFLVCDLQNITEIDRGVYKSICKKFRNIYLILNKSDKVKNDYFFCHRQKIFSFFPNITENRVISLSAKKKTNLFLLRKIINDLLGKIK